MSMKEWTEEECGRAGCRHIKYAVDHGENVIFPPMTVYLANFEARVPHPRRFMYHACTAVDKYGNKCGKSRSGRLITCQHIKEERYADAVENRYRFHVFLFDAIEAAPPVKVALFSVAEKLLGMSITQFLNNNAREQDDIVYQALVAMPLCSVIVKVQHQDVVLQSLDFVRQPKWGSTFPLCREIAEPVMQTPPNRGLGSSSSSSTARRGKGVTPKDMQECVEKVAQVLADTFLAKGVDGGDE